MIEEIVIRNTVTDVSIEMNMLTSSYVLISADFGTISGNHQTYKYPSQIGSSLYSSLLETRSVSIIGYVIGYNPSEIKQGKKVLNNLINPLHPLEILVNGKYTITVNPTSTVKYTQSDSENNEYMCKFGIDGIAHDPMFYAPEDVTKGNYVKGMFHFPLVIPEEEGVVFGEISRSTICTVVNDSPVDIGFIIRMKSEGYVTNPTFINIETNEQIRITNHYTPGHELIINTNEAKRSVVGFHGRWNATGDKLYDNELNNLDEDNKSWLKLKQGVNSIRYSADSGVEKMRVSIIYQNKYLEVD